MNLKRKLSLLLVGALLAGLLAAPSSAASVSAFSDIHDADVAEAAEVLRALGVVDGTGDNQFQPDRVLTRAEFCKMAIEIMGRGEEAARQSSRVIFSDVKGDHWARGYINAAASRPSETQPPLVTGVGNGLFLPQEPITYGAAAAILLRALGYTDADVGMGLNWYDGYVSMANSVGLADGVQADGSTSITRAQAAVLFRNLLFADLKDSTTPYLTKLGATQQSSAIILSVDAVAADGSAGAVRTAQGVYRTDRAPFPASYEGTRGKVVLDRHENVLAIEPDNTGSDRLVSAVAVEATYVRIAGGERLDVTKPGSVMVYSADKDAASYETAWPDLRTGAQLIFHYSASGTLEYIYQRSSSELESMVAETVSAGVNPFTQLVSGVGSYRIYKNGVPASVNDIRRFDTATYDASAGILQISDLKLTGVYQSAYPNLSTPTTVTIMNETFTVLPGAAQSLSQFRLGDTITLLLTLDGCVAGAVSASQVRAATVGVVTAASGSSVTVRSILLDREFSGSTNYTGDQALALMGQLVTISSGNSNRITVSPLTSGGTAGAWDVKNGTVGGTALADNVKVFEKVNNSKLYEISPEDVLCTGVPASKILYVGTDYAGKVSLLIVNDVTGDHYTYGLLTADRTLTGHFGGSDIYNNTVTVQTPNGSKTYVGSVPNFTAGAPGGIIPALNSLNGQEKLAGSLMLQSVQGVSRTAFTTVNGQTSVVAGGVVYPVAENVICYNEAAGSWFSSLAQTRAFSDNLTVYFDKTPDQGGKVRMVVAE